MPLSLLLTPSTGTGVISLDLNGSTASFTTIFGAAVSTQLSINGHSWTADQTGEYQTTADLATEWQTFYQVMQSGKGSTLNDIQRLEGNAQAVFLNTGLAKLSSTQQAIDRADVQREFDALAGAMQLAGVSLNAPLTGQSYLTVGQTMQGNATLEELAMQGHGLNQPPDARYAGYTNDFQNNVDKTTRYIGGGLNNNRNAITDFFDDNLLSHMPFPVIYKDGTLVQLNQNGNPENSLTNAVASLDDSLFYRTYGASDFAAKPSAANTAYVSPALAIIQAANATPVPAGDIRTLDGFVVSANITSTAHAWTANSQGLFVTTADLASEWYNAYVDLVTVGGKDLTPELRLEANAEAVFLNTGLAKASAADQVLYRQDIQRQFDAEFAAMSIAGINPAAPLTAASYLAVEHALQSNAQLEELALQGHGLNSPPSAVYNGYTMDFQHGVDTTTLYVGGGLNNGKAAVTDFLDDNILSHMPFAVIVKNGEVVQLNQNGAPENRLSHAVAALDASMHVRIYYAGDFTTA